ncbi:probable receptor-like protein kinase [Tanacetum coccineum]
MVFCCRYSDIRPPIPHIIQNEWSDSDTRPPIPQNIWNERFDPDTPTPNVRSSSLRVFTFWELKKATTNFKVSPEIADNGFGRVHIGIIKSLEHPFDDIHMAVKRGGHKEWEAKVKVVGEIKHQNLVKLIGFCNVDDECRFLVYEYMPDKSLDGHISALSWDMRLIIAQDAATGLAYLHEGMHSQIIFRDFKPSNILLDSQMNAKLTNFGLAREGPHNESTHVSTTSVLETNAYLAPEYIYTRRLSSAIDVWSYGIFLEELITGSLRTLVQENTESINLCVRWVCGYPVVGKTSNLIADPRLEGKYSEKSIEKVAEIATKCLANDPKLRPNMSEVLKVVKEALELEILNHQLPNADKT